MANNYTGADPGFKARVGALKNIAPGGGRREKFGVFRVKNYDFTPKNHIFSNFRGGGARSGCAPWIRPCYNTADHVSIVSDWTVSTFYRNQLCFFKQGFYRNL